MLGPYGYISASDWPLMIVSISDNFFPFLKNAFCILIRIFQKFKEISGSDSLVANTDTPSISGSMVTGR